MKTWIFRLSISLNIVIIVLVLGAWINKNVIIRQFLLTIYDARVSFFDSFPLDSGDIVMLGDSMYWRAYSLLSCVSRRRYFLKSVPMTLLWVLSVM